MADTGAASIDRGRAKRERMTPLFNDAFLRIFGGPDSHRATRSLVNALFREAGIPEIGDIEALTAEHTDVGDTVSLRAARYDVLIVAGDRLVDLEAQRRDEDVEDKALFYAAKLLASSARKGVGIGELPQAIVVMLYEGRPILPDDGRAVHTCRMRWDTADSRPGSDRALFVLAELERVRERYNGGITGDVLADEALSWLYVLARGYADEREVEMMRMEMPSIEEFSRLYGIALDDPEIAKRYDRHHEAVMEYNSEMKYQERLRREGREQIVDKLRELGADEELIEKALAAVQEEQ